MKEFMIAPSILAADFANLGKETESVIEAGADMIHFDVMDNQFVPNLSIGPMVCKSLRQHGINAPIDVHLMVQPNVAPVAQPAAQEPLTPPRVRRCRSHREVSNHPAAGGGCVRPAP